MKVYLDIFFLVNLGMDFVVLVLESFFQKRKIRLCRLLLTAATGAVLSTLFLVFGVHRHIWLFWLLYLVGSVGLIRIAFGKTTAGGFVKNLVFFYLASFLLAGILMQAQNIFAIRGNALFLLGGAGAVLGIVHRMMPEGKRWHEETENYFPVTVFCGGRSVHGNGLLDTGNHLTEPFSREPVIIGDKKFIEPLLSGEEKPLIRYIPFRSVGKESGMIPVFRAAYIEVSGKNGVCFREEAPWIAICENYVSADGEYEVILHPHILNNFTIQNGG